MTHGFVQIPFKVIFARLPEPDGLLTLGGLPCEEFSPSLFIGDLGVGEEEHVTCPRLL